ncbi:hypothetical protein [Bacillus thuringiensis]
MIVRIGAFGTSVQEEFEISDSSMVDWEVEIFAGQISYGYEAIEEDEEVN